MSFEIRPVIVSYPTRPAAVSPQTWLVVDKKFAGMVFESSKTPVGTRLLPQQIDPSLSKTIHVSSTELDVERL